ncbi:hypothetical protein LJB83_01750 [Clostridia bacterium OttesenSCG-928-F22]|nr:hypothetical protein [Clostridia bacterium OttesenSCG-928-F22]
MVWLFLLLGIILFLLLLALIPLRLKLDLYADFKENHGLASIGLLYGLLPIRLHFRVVLKKGEPISFEWRLFRKWKKLKQKEKKKKKSRLGLKEFFDAVTLLEAGMQLSFGIEDDAALTAQLYGLLCALFNAMLAVGKEKYPKIEANVSIAPKFGTNAFELKLKCIVLAKLAHIIIKWIKNSIKSREAD